MNGIYLSVTVLSDDTLSSRSVRGIFLILISVAVKEEDYIGILFDGARFT